MTPKRTVSRRQDQMVRKWGRGRGHPWRSRLQLGAETAPEAIGETRTTGEGGDANWVPGLVSPRSPHCQTAFKGKK